MHPYQMFKKAFIHIQKFNDNSLPLSSAYNIESIIAIY